MATDRELEQRAGKKPSSQNGSNGSSTAGKAVTKALMMQQRLHSQELEESAAQQQ